MHQFYEFNNLPPFLVPTAPLVQMIPTKGRFAWVFGGVYTVLGETTRNPTNTMVKPLDSNRAVAVVERCKSCLVSRSISNLRVVYALARRQ